MVNVIALCKAVGQAVEIVDGAEDIVGHNVLGDENFHVLLHGALQGLRVTGTLVNQVLHHDAANLFPDAQLFFHILADELGNVNHAVVHHAHTLAFNQHVNMAYAAIGNGHGLLAGEDLALFGNNFAGEGVNHRFGQAAAGNTGIKGLLLVELVTAHIGNLVAAAIIEQTVKQTLGRLHRGRIARAELAVDLDEALFPALGSVLLDGGDDALILTVDLANALVGDGAHGSVINAGEPCGGLVRIVGTHGL